MNQRRQPKQGGEQPARQEEQRGSQQSVTFSTRLPGSRFSTKCRRFSRRTALWKKVTLPLMSPRMEGVLWAPR